MTAGDIPVPGTALLLAVAPVPLALAAMAGAALRLWRE
jgi:hypothetical protein